MDWRDWELFCEVVEHAGFSAAAWVLGHPKSSLSAAVQRLQGQLGLRLIERTTRHLRLTDAGEKIEVSIDGERVALMDINPRMNEQDPNGLTMQTPKVHIKAGEHRV